MGKILDGKKISADLYQQLKSRIEALRRRGVVPGLATVLVGEDPASHVYVGQKIKKCREIGLESIHRPLPADISMDRLLATVGELNKDSKVHGIIVQLPLPAHLDPERVIQTIDNNKDADGLHPLNQGYLVRMKSWDEIIKSGIPLPCTPAGVIRMLQYEKIPVAGKSVVIVGRSTLVGKPLAQLFLSLDATVTIAHSRTADLPGICRQADILVAAIGKQEFIKGNFIKDGAVVVDVGISRTQNGLKGDVDFNAALSKASWITPVPGGVGAMTVAMLLQNTVAAAEK